MKLSDIIDTGVLEDEIRAGYVTRRVHPEFPELAILNYTDKCQFDQHWNDVTLQTRGLIYNTDTGEVVARALPKFFNVGDETHTGQLDPDRTTFGADEKYDGSLGIIYRRPDEALAVATRGSFSSDQAIHATELLQSEYDPVPLDGMIDMNLTPLVEIVFPDNRIVLDYGDRDELVPLGVVDNGSGQFKRASGAEVFPEGTTLRTILESPPVENKEGYVIWVERNKAVKLKFATYLALHRIVSNLTEKEVWRQLKAGTFEEFVVALPDEFHQWATDTAQPLQIAASSIENRVFVWHRILVAEGYETRKEQALWIQENVEADYRGLVFGLLDNRDISEGIWKLLEPKGANTNV